MTVEPGRGRYARQQQLGCLGPAGQAQLGRSSVLVVGCGALGSNLASLLARAGVGRLLLVDSDGPDLMNLHRQVLYNEDDVAGGAPKAEIAAAKLRRVNSAVRVEGRVLRVDAANVEPLVQDVDLVLDGTDNLPTRYLLNDACIKHRTPWIYGGVVGTTGMTLTVLPGKGPCLRCLFPSPPEPDKLPSCESHGVLGTAPAVIAALQATDAIKLLCGAEAAGGLLAVDLWERTFQQIHIVPDPACPACGLRRFDHLAQQQAARP